MRWLAWISGVAAVIGLFFLVAPKDIRARKVNIVGVLGSAQAIGSALDEFNAEYGKYPDNSTVAPMREATESKLTFSNRTSNDLFAQLLASGVTNQERLFYAKAKSTRIPDDKFDTDSTMLEHGECAFAYISGLQSTGTPGTPQVFGPVIPGTMTLDRESCEGYAAVRKTDGTVEKYPIDSAGKIILPNGLDLLDPRQPFWHGKAPDVKWPK